MYHVDQRKRQQSLFNPYIEGYFSDVCVEGEGVKLPPRSILASRLARNKIPTATPVDVFGAKLFNGAISNTPR